MSDQSAVQQNRGLYAANCVNYNLLGWALHERAYGLGNAKIRTSLAEYLVKRLLHLIAAVVIVATKVLTHERALR